FLYKVVDKMVIKKAEEKEKQLLEAFKELIDGDNINKAKADIEEQLKSFVVYLQKNLNPNQRIFESLESRIKGQQSFSEKIFRKEYLQSWEVTNNLNSNKELIAKQLPDLIGFRITCFFWEDEKSIYQLLKTYYDSGKFNKLTINFDENCKQKNGHNIYKISGLYNNEYCFELQIKSIMHNIWGEVEHKTIYKSQLFDPNMETKKSISEELFNILKAADKQLLILFKESNTEEKLLQSLFFIRTKTQSAEKIKTYILAEHYERFFKVFSSEIDRIKIKNYVVSALQQKKYKREKVKSSEVSSFEEGIINEIKNNFYEYDLKAMFHIASIIYSFQSYNRFLYYLANRLICQCELKNDEIDFSDDEFDDPWDKVDSQEQTRKNIIMLLNQKIGRRKI
nr:hypothetical protein [Clostridia bacterium]